MFDYVAQAIVVEVLTCWNSQAHCEELGRKTRVEREVGITGKLALMLIHHSSVTSHGSERADSMLGMCPMSAAM